MFRSVLVSALAVGALLGALGCGSSSAAPTGLPLPNVPDPDEDKSAGNTLLAHEASRELGLMTSTSYTHTVNVVESDGVFDYDCSGFLDYALIKVLPKHYDELVDATDSRPRAQDFVSYLGAPTASDWANVAHVADLQVGDILAWLAAADDDGDTGHVMIVRSAPRADANHMGAYDVDIWDATVDPHGTDDSRHASAATGLGTGTVVVYTNSDGTPAQHAWSTISSSTDSAKVAMGRAL